VNKQDIEKYLRMLGQELQKRQITGEILLAGGAVMLLKVQNREVTKDIDAYFPSNQASVIRDAARVVAEREGLANDWINDGVKGFFYRQPPAERWAEYPGLRVYVTSLDYLFTMKAVAGRPQDIDDMKAIANELKLTNAQDALALVKKYIPEQLLVPRIEYVIEEIFE
jgi:predicted nucleotidyltransferase